MMISVLKLCELSSTESHRSRYPMALINQFLTLDS